MRRSVVSLVCTVPLLTATVAAHHSYVSKYDGSRTIQLAGVIGSVSYANPHIFFDLDTANGTWRVETESIPAARGRGLTEERLRTGAAVVVTGWPARDKSGALGLGTIRFKNGPTIKMRGTAR